MTKISTFRSIEYKGTIESYNELVTNLGDDPCKPYMFLDENFHSTWRFTGIVGTSQGIIYRPGDWYNIEIKEIEI